MWSTLFSWAKFVGGFPVLWHILLLKICIICTAVGNARLFSFLFNFHVFTHLLYVLRATRIVDCYQLRQLCTYQTTARHYCGNDCRDLLVNGDQAILIPQLASIYFTVDQSHLAAVQLSCKLHGKKQLITRDHLVICMLQVLCNEKICLKIT